MKKGKAVKSFLHELIMQQGFYMDPATLKIKPRSTFRTLLKLMLRCRKEKAVILNFNQKKKQNPKLSA